MQVSNDWPMDEAFGGPGLPDCIIEICKHSDNFYECEICYVELQKIQELKRKANYSKWYRYSYFHCIC